jgi:epsilon-lactone hydrolase
LGGVPVIYIDIPGTTTDGVILYFHGGFFAIGSAATSVGLAADLARNARMQVATVDYRLAPEHPYPAAPQDAMTAYRALLEAGQDVSRVALAGESAGAGRRRGRADPGRRLPPRAHSGSHSRNRRTPRLSGREFTW